MLSRLYIQNYVLISEIDLQFNKGFNVITGETGAGKSILLGALNLILGKRVDTSVLTKKDKKCIIEATFSIKNYRLEELFSELDIDYDHESIIRREIAVSGKSRAFINDTPVNLQVLKKITSQLVDLHEQQDTFPKLLSEDFLISLLDKLAKNEDLIEKYQSNFKVLREIDSEIDNTRQKITNNKQDNDYNLFLLNELKELNLDPTNDNNIESQLKILSNAEFIKSSISQINNIVENNDIGTENQLREIIRLLSPLSSIDKKINTTLERVENLLVELQDVQNELTDISENTNLDEEMLVYLQDRQSKINKLYIKHSVQSTDELLATQQKLELQFSGNDELEDHLKNLLAKQIEFKETCLQLATEISKNRNSKFEIVVNEVNNVLKKIGMQFSQIKITNNQTKELSVIGIDKIQLMFSPNKGASFDTLQKVGSGGEKSRLMLAFQSLIASSMTLPTLIFDEIDTGVSGEVALKVGDLLQKMSQHHQIISISHLPQIAAKADEHFYVFKEQTDNNTQTFLKKLNNNERLNEIATMLSGKNPGEAAVRNAKELMALN